MIERLTARGKSGFSYFPQCLQAPCYGMGCVSPNCTFIVRVCEKLCRYEETAAAASTTTTEHKKNIHLHNTIICDKSQIRRCGDAYELDGKRYVVCLVPEEVLE